MTDFRLRPMHRQRKGRRKRVTVLNHKQLAELLDVPLSEVKAKLDALGCRYHQDSAGALWAKPPEQVE